MKSAAQVVALLLDGGYESYDYSPEDLARYQQLKAEQAQLQQQGRMYADGQITPEWNANWIAFEQVKNKYNGMSPSQQPQGQ